LQQHNDVIDLLEACRQTIGCGLRAAASLRRRSQLLQQVACHD
jgi:hypothetical protein